MDYNTLEPNSFISELKCSLCKNYLSYFPIHLTKNNLNICGRCQVPEDPENSEVVPHIRNEVYEIIAKEVTFPCRYVVEGCMKKLLAKDIPDHENKCPLRLVKCPASLLDLCTDTVSLLEVAKHCKNYHWDLILEQQTFNIDLSESKSCDNIVVTENGCFIFKRTFEADTKNLSCTLMCSDNDQRVVFDSFKLSLKNDTTTILRKFSKHRRSAFRTDICLKVFESPGSSPIIEAELLSQEPKENHLVLKNEIAEKILKIFQCTGCRKHLRPPMKIYFKSKKLYCHSCRSTNYSYTYDSENFNNLAEMLFYPCKYQANGCDHKSQPSLLNHHELICSFQANSCPLGEKGACPWKGMAHETISHISADHVKDMVTYSQFAFQVRDGFGSLNFSKSHVIKFANHYFRFCFLSQKECCRWSVQMIGQFLDCFKYEIEIVDVNNRRKLLTSKMCTPLVEESLLFRSNDDHCHFTLSQFEDMLSSGCLLMFKVRIFM